MKPEISICIITYNQENYIRKAIKGALAQHIDVPYEIVISDDCSTDSTQELCLEYQEEYPNTIRVVRQPVNLGVGKHWVSAINECSGKYVSLCEGDDYFIDPFKIKKQYEFMRDNPQYSLCSHEVYVDHELASRSFRGAVGIWLDNIQLSGLQVIPSMSFWALFQKDVFWKRRRMYRGHKRYRTASFEQILISQLEGRYIHTVSMFTKAEVLKRFPPALLESAGFHRASIVWLALNGRVRHDACVMGMRVIQSDSSAITKREKKLSEMGPRVAGTKREFVNSILPYCTDSQRRMIEERDFGE